MGEGAFAAVKPPFNYHGAKTSVAQRVVALLPEHKHYVEPFAGSLAVLLAKQKTTQETVNDLDEDLVLFWRVLRERPDELEQACELTPCSRFEHDLSRERPESLPDLERARRTWVALTQGWSGTTKHKGWTRCVKTTGDALPASKARGIARLPAVAERIRDVVLEHRPALEVVEAYGRSEDALLYVDPPYPQTSQSSYSHPMRGEGEHRELAEALRASNAAVVASGHAVDLYEDLYRGWHRAEIPVRGGNRNGQPIRRTEVLWSNRPLPSAAPEAS